MEALLAVYALSASGLKTRYPDGFAVPPPVLRLSGDLILLRDMDPENVEESSISAFSVQREVLEKKLFGDPRMHYMKEYLYRIYLILGVPDAESVFG
jgi:hypothetical protein